MPHITRELIRRRSEHNEGIITTLEELTLHQEELEEINEVMGGTCRGLKILYLQNNVIGRIENLHHLKDLQYLNLALNNITKIEGLGSCEFLNKLDLTVNFIDFDHLEESIAHLASRRHLKDLYMMGNPSQQKWGDSFLHYVIHRLPHVQYLDGKEITRSMQIVAGQKFPALEEELGRLADEVRQEKGAVSCSASAGRAEEKAAGNKKDPVQPGCLTEDELESSRSKKRDGQDEEEATQHDPETRKQMYLEMAEQKKEKEERQREMAPKERDFDKEQAERVAEVRRRDLEEGEVRQCNEGKWEFRLDEEERPGHVVLDLNVPRHLDSSLIDVDIHPNWVSVIIKSKLLRLKLPAEVKVGESKAQRSKTTGHLVLIMPKADPMENALTIRAERRLREQDEKRKSSAAATGRLTKPKPIGLNNNVNKNRTRRKEVSTTTSLAEEMMRACQASNDTGSGKAVDLRGIVRNSPASEDDADKKSRNAITPVVSVKYSEKLGQGDRQASGNAGSNINKEESAVLADNEGVPPLI